MSVLYEHLSAMEDAGFLDENGKPKLDEDGNPLAWSKGGWGGRQSTSEEGENESDGVEGRNFKSGKVFLDPKIFGVKEEDPDYQSYLSGAKLPPGYLEMMEKYKKGELNGETLNNLRQTNFGNYGRQAEKPEFKPSWAKMKLKKTNQGSMIRLGQYEDSPSKSMNRVRKPEDTDGPVDDSSGPKEVVSKSSVEVAPTVQESVKSDVESDTAKQNEIAASEDAQVAESEKSAESSMPDETEQAPPRPKKFNFNDYYYNAQPPAPSKPSLPTPVTQPEAPPQHVPAEDVEEVEEVEEYEEEYEEFVEEYEEEEEEELDAHEVKNSVESAPASAESNLTDLQAILAQKQAELRRLQGLSS